MAMLPVFCDFVAGYFTLLCSSADARSFIFCSPRKWSHTASCVPNVSQIKDLGCLCKRGHSRPTVLRNPSCRRISVLLYSKDYYFSHVYSNRIWRVDSLRQYLDYCFIFGYTLRVLFCFRLYCSFAKLFKFNLYFAYCSLKYHRIQIYCFHFTFHISHFTFLILHFAFCILHFLEPWVRVVAYMQHERSHTRATKIFLKIPHRLESSSFFAYFFSPKEKK